MGVVIVGVALGQKREPTAVCVVDGERRRFHEHPKSPRIECHFAVRHLERLPAGTPFPEVAVRLAEIIGAVRQRTGRVPQVFVNATGLGDPIVNLLGQKVQRITPVYFNHGDRRAVESMDTEVRLGKAWLVARLQALLQSGVLHLPKTDQAETLARELLDFEISVTEDANDRYGAFRVGSHDDLVTALGLAVQEDPPTPHRVVHRLVLA